jgi:hypothetical protein
MIRLFLFWSVMICALVGAGVRGYALGGELASGQKHRKQKLATICGNPKAPCKTDFTFQPHELPFRISTRSVIYDSVPFYAIILKSVRAPNDDCNAIVSEGERERAQALFPDHKVFASRCYEPGTVYYTNVGENQHFMAVYAGATRAEARAVLAAVKATGQYSGANLRRMRAGINGT